VLRSDFLFPILDKLAALSNLFMIGILPVQSCLGLSRAASGAKQGGKNATSNILSVWLNPDPLFWTSSNGHAAGGRCKAAGVQCRYAMQLQWGGRAFSRSRFGACVGPGGMQRLGAFTNAYYLGSVSLLTRAFSTCRIFSR
jgi:hypothetical protein